MSPGKAPAKAPLAPVALPYCEPVAVAVLKGETHLVLRPDAETRARIAAFAGLHAVRDFEARLTLQPKPDGTVALTGRLEAAIEPLCVVTLEPFADHVSERVEATFAPAEMLARLMARETGENEDAPSDGSPDWPDEIVDGQIDPAALAVEFLILGLDPYPRKPDAAFPDLRVGEEVISPFAALGALKPDREG